MQAGKKRGIVWKPHMAYIYKNDDKNGGKVKKGSGIFLGTFASLTAPVTMNEKVRGLGSGYLVLQFFHCLFSCVSSPLFFHSGKRGKKTS